MFLSSSVSGVWYGGGGGRSYIASLLLSGGDLAYVDCRCGTVAACFEAGGGRVDGPAVAGVGGEEGGDVLRGEVGEVTLDPGDEVGLGEDVGGRDDGAFVCVVLWSSGVSCSTELGKSARHTPTSNLNPLTFPFASCTLGNPTTYSSSVTGINALSNSHQPLPITLVRGSQQTNSPSASADSSTPSSPPTATSTNPSPPNTQTRPSPLYTPPAPQSHRNAVPAWHHQTAAVSAPTATPR